jgi:predicted membrane channel-forming protein YqfA (hemolysin III family)
MAAPGHAGAFTTCVTLLPFFQTKRFRPFRAGLFAGLGLWGVFPAAHALWLHGAAPAVRRFFVLDMLMGAVYLVRLPYILMSLTKLNENVRENPWKMNMESACTHLVV